MLIKGILPPKKKLPTLNELIDSKIIGKINSEIDDLDTKIEVSLDEKSKEIDSKLQEVDLHTETSKIVIDKKIEEVDKTISKVEEKIANIRSGDPGEPGKDAEPIDEEKIIEEVLARIPPLDKEGLTKAILSQIPKVEIPTIDENKLLAKFLKKIPSKKGDLKIIQEKIETDPMSVIEEIMKLPDDKFKLKSSQIDGLDQTIRAFQSQLSRGYLHGGGLAKISHDTTLTGDGTPSSPLSAAGVAENYKLKVTSADTTPSYLNDKILAGTGISITKENAGANEDLKIANTAPDQTVAISAGTNITSVTGTYPNFTINAANQTTSLAGETLDVITGRGNITANPIAVGEVLTKESTTLSYTGSQLTGVAKTGGSSKVITYNVDNTVHTVVATLGSTVITKLLNWSGGILQSITVS